MAFLAGLGRAMTALGQDLSFTKREDEERARQEEAAEAEAERRRLAGRAAVSMRAGDFEPGTPGYGTAIDAMSAAGVNPVSAMPEPGFDPATDPALGRLKARTANPALYGDVPEPDVGEWVDIRRTEQGDMLQEHSITGEVRRRRGPEGEVIRDAPPGGGMTERERLVRKYVPEEQPPPADSTELQTISADQADYLRSQGMSDEDIGRRYNIVE